MTQSVIEWVTTRSVGTISSAKRAVAFDLHTAAAHTPQNATWVQAERRRCGVGRAAWMPRERRQDMDVRSARAHGVSSECGYPTKSGLTRSQTLGYLVSFQVTRRRRNSLAVRTNQTISVTPNSGNAHHPSELARESVGTSAASWQPGPRIRGQARSYNKAC